MREIRARYARGRLKAAAQYVLDSVVEQQDNRRYTRLRANWAVAGLAALALAATPFAVQYYRMSSGAGGDASAAGGGFPLLAALCAALVVSGAGLLYIAWRLPSIMSALRLVNSGSDPARISIQTIEDQFEASPDSITDPMEERYGARAEGMLPRKLLKAVEAWSDPAKPSPPVVVARDFCEIDPLPVYWANVRKRHRRGLDGTPRRTEVNANYRRKMRRLRNAVKFAAVYNAIGAYIRDERPNEPNWFRDLYTQPRNQHLGFWDKHDLPPRFRTASPHMFWPDGGASNPNERGPVIRGFECVENPGRLPMHVLTVDDLIACMPEAADILPEISDDADDDERRAAAGSVLQRLGTVTLPTFSKRRTKDLTQEMVQNDRKESILRRRDGRPASEAADPADLLDMQWIMRFDPNRLVLSQLNPNDADRILLDLAVLMRAIWIAMSTRASRVVLRRGDAMFIDNQRALVARLEPDFRDLPRRARLGLAPATWWLRGYLGFRWANASTPAAGPSRSYADGDRPLADPADAIAISPEARSVV